MSSCYDYGMYSSAVAFPQYLGLFLQSEGNILPLFHHCASDVMSPQYVWGTLPIIGGMTI